MLVTGATGFLGGAVCRLLQARGIRLLATGRDEAKLALLKAEGIETIQADLANVDPARFSQQIGIVQAVVHAAALSSPWGKKHAFEAANITATEHLLKVASIAGVQRFIMVSSPSVYFRFADQIGVREDLPLPDPVNFYADTKQRAEKLVAASSIGMRIVLRPRGIYGKGDVALLPRMLRAAVSGPLPLLRDGVALTDITHVEDVAEAVWSSLVCDLPEDQHTFNISGGEPLPLVKIIEQACRMNDIKLRWKRLPAGLVIKAARLLEIVHSVLPGHPEPRITAYSAGIIAYSQTLDISKAASELGWKPRISFDDGLHKTFGSLP